MNNRTVSGSGYFRLDGEIHSGNSGEWQKKLMEAAGSSGGGLELDASGLTYISSAGLRMLLTVQQRLNGRLTIRDVSPEIYDVFEMTGFTTLMEIRKKPREIRVDQCPVIGKGAFGTVYRLDEDTVVKVYNRSVALTDIEEEQKKAKKAFLKGVPTAIAFDIVRVGECFGTVFEMVKAKSCNDLLIEEPHRLEEITDRFTAFLKALHATEMEEGTFPDQRKVYLGYVDGLKSALTEERADRLSALLLAMPADLHLVHGDIQLKNVMFSNGELMLIDMDTISTGDPAFEFAGLYMDYMAFNEDEPENSLHFFGLDKDTCTALFYGTLDRYLGGPGERDRAVMDRIRLLGYLRFLYTLTTHQAGSEELREQRIRRACRSIAELLPGVGPLTLK